VPTTFLESFSSPIAGLSPHGSQGHAGQVANVRPRHQPYPQVCILPLLTLAQQRFLTASILRQDPNLLNVYRAYTKDESSVFLCSRLSAFAA
jgi:hypothetical protein